MGLPHDFDDFAEILSRIHGFFCRSIGGNSTRVWVLRLKLLHLACMSPPEKSLWKPLPDQKQRQAQAGRDLEMGNPTPPASLGIYEFYPLNRPWWGMLNIEGMGLVMILGMPPVR